MAHFLKLNCESVSDLPMKGKIPFGYRTNLDPGLIFLLGFFSLAYRSPIRGSIEKSEPCIWLIPLRINREWRFLL